jgi:tetratricopeptide (TPR) repeat protein
MLEQALALMPPEIVREDLGDDGAEVARMVPELRRRFPDIGEPLDLPPEQQRRYFFNAVSSFVARGSARFPLLLVIDDIHWADEATLLLTEHMAEQMPGIRVLGVGTYRDVELDVARPLASSVERLLRAHLVDRIQIKRLDIQAVSSMLEALGGRSLPGVVVQAIYDETEGNPFFVEEVYRHLVEDGKLFDASGEVRTDINVDELDVPESVRLVIGRRLQRLGATAQPILAAGAVVGRAFPFRLLEELVDVDADELLDVVEAAEAARIIVAEERDGDVHYTFGHELIRQTLLAGLSVLRRQRLHLAVVDAIERSDPRSARDRPSELAAHLLQAGAAADPERVLAYLEAAADRAMDAAAFEEALRAVDDALAIAEDDDPIRQARLMERRGWAVRALGHFDECIRTWDRVIDVYASSGRTEEAGLLCREAAYQLIWLTRFDEAFAMLARGLDIVGDSPGQARARLLAQVGGMTGLAGFHDQGEDHLREAELVTTQLGDEPSLGHVLWGRLMSQWSHTRSHEAIVTGRRAIELLRRHDQLWTLVDALAWTAYPLLASTDPAEVAEGGAMAQEAIELGRRLGHRGGEVLGVRGDVMRRSLSADANGFVKLCHEDLDAFASIETPWVSLSHAFLASALILRGDLEEALEHSARATELETPTAWSGHGWVYTLLARAWLGEVDECRRLLATAPVPVPEPGTRPPVGVTFCTMTAIQACVVAGLRAEAAERHLAMASLVDLAPVNGFDRCTPARAAAMAAAAAEDWEAAEDLFDRARREMAPFPDTLEHPQIELWHADALIQRGRPSDRERARALLPPAEATCRRLGLTLLAGRAAQLLRDLDA